MKKLSKPYRGVKDKNRRKRSKPLSKKRRYETSTKFSTKNSPNEGLKHYHVYNVKIKGDGNKIKVVNMINDPANRSDASEDKLIATLSSILDLFGKFFERIISALRG